MALHASPPQLLKTYLPTTTLPLAGNIFRGRRGRFSPQLHGSRPVAPISLRPPRGATACRLPSKTMTNTTTLPKPIATNGTPPRAHVYSRPTQRLLQLRLLGGRDVVAVVRVWCGPRRRCTAAVRVGRRLPEQGEAGEEAQDGQHDRQLHVQNPSQDPAKVPQKRRVRYQQRN